jgi:hypothetical protein
MSPPFDVAVVIPSRDAQPHVLVAVESALAQTRPPVEVIVVDDASSDGTGAAIEARFGDDRRAPVRVLRGEFGSPAAARNAGWRAAAAPWIALLDADDEWLPEKLERAAAAITRAPGAAWFFSDGTFRTLEGELHPSAFALCADVPEAYVGSPVAELFEVNFVLTSSVVVRRDTLERLGGFDETFTHTEDLELWIRLARDGPAAASRFVLLRYQHRPEGLSQQIERRLLGDVELFGRLAADAALPPGLRRAARRRRALARYKMAVAALRAGDADGARRQLRESWLFPERVLPVVSAWVASLLPSRGLVALRRQGWPARVLGSRFVSHRRVRLGGPAGEAR